MAFLYNDTLSAGTICQQAGRVLETQECATTIHDKMSKEENSYLTESDETIKNSRVIGIGKMSQTREMCFFEVLC